MRKTLYLKFILAYVLFGIFGFIVVATFVSRMTLDHCRTEKADALYREATMIANTYASDLYNSEISLDSAQRQLRALAAYLDAEIWIINPSGRLVLNSEDKGAAQDEIVISGFTPSITGSSYYVEGQFFDTFPENRLSVLAPITSDYKVRGYVIIHVPTDNVYDHANSLLNISYLMLIIILLLSMIILIFFTEIVYIPLKKIITGAEQYAAGNMHYRINVESEDEMGYLGSSLNYMADEIARSEDDQKKFIANVSHDFRSPLTSIHGFLEAMLDGTIPPELHEKYLAVCLSETERLTKLTNGLLTLNNLGTRGMLLTKTDFDINETVRRVALTFEQQCRDKNIAIDLVLTGENLYCNADEEKIQQVLVNLIDNAIKFSPAGSSVKLETTDRRNKIYVSVKDSGIGIPKEDQKLVWDRFYKSDLSRGKDKKGTGLGLSIVREIIRAHSENINLISTEGVGSEFIFSLKRSEINDEIDD